MTTGQRIKVARKKAGMTQKQLAQKCGMADSAIRKYESGKIEPKLVTAQKIASALGVRVEDILGLESFDSGAEFDKCLPTGLTAALDQLNEEGLREAERAVTLLTEVPKYKK